MSIEQPSSVTVGSLLSEDLRIPEYQRPYAWEPANALQLLEDIRAAQTAPEPPEFCALGSIVLHTHDGFFDIVDGQQRVLT